MSIFKDHFEIKRTCCQESAEDLAGNYPRSISQLETGAIFSNWEKVYEGEGKSDDACLQWPTRGESIYPHLICEDPVCIAACRRITGGMIAMMSWEMQKDIERPWEKPWAIYWFLVVLIVIFFWNCSRLFSGQKNAETICPYPRYATEPFLSRWNPANYITKAAWVTNTWSSIVYCPGSASQLLGKLSQAHRCKVTQIPSGPHHCVSQAKSLMYVKKEKENIFV